MIKSERKPNLQWLVKTYFSNSKKLIKLQKGEILIRENQFNDRLYFIHSGALTGYIKSPEGDQIELFKATPNLFVGLYSYFSKTYSSSATVIADVESEVSYIDQRQILCDPRSRASLFEQFMPVVVTELVNRQQRSQTIAIEKELTFKKLIHTEKMASLGQMAAGIAHELNNAIAVIQRNNQWQCENVNKLIKEKYPENHQFFQIGLKWGRQFSSREVRKRGKMLKEVFSLPGDTSKKISQTGIPDEDFEKIGERLINEGENINYFWEIGATFHDMSIAAQQSAHVVKSVKALGVQQSKREAGQDVNESIREALTLLASPLRKIHVQLSLSPLSPIFANNGELVQIWTNLIKNACESMTNGNTENPELEIVSKLENNFIAVHVQDNGPGIPPKILSTIFQPNMTTKTGGLSFGLGLGLTILQKLVDSYKGNVSVESVPDKTVFTIKIPVGGTDGKT